MQVHYHARYASQRFVLRGPRPIRDQELQVIGYDPGKVINFERGRFVTEDSEEIAFLDKAIGPGSPDLTRLTVEEAGELPLTPIGPQIAQTTSTKSTSVKREYRCAKCGQADFPDALAYGRHMSKHKRDERAAAKAKPAEAVAASA